MHFFVVVFTSLVLLFIAPLELANFVSYLNSPNFKSTELKFDGTKIKQTFCPNDFTSGIRFNASGEFEEIHVPDLKTILTPKSSKAEISNLFAIQCFEITALTSTSGKLAIYEYNTRIPNPISLVLIIWVWIIMWGFKAKFVFIRSKSFWITSLLIVISVSSRWQLLPSALLHGIEPDAISYRNLSQTITDSLGTQSREPLFVFWLKPIVDLGKTIEFTNRLATIILSVVVVVSSYSIFAKKYGWITGSFVAFFVAIHPLSQTLSVRGMRDELISLLSLYLFYCLFVVIKSNLFRSMIIGSLIGLLVLARIETLSFSLIMLGFALLTNKIKFSSLFIIIISVMLFVAPYLNHNYKLYKDPIYPSTLHATWFRNYEFIIDKKTGCSGCPSWNEFVRDSSGGTRISSLQYLFNYHSPSEIISQSIRGGLNLLLLRHNAIVFLWPDHFVIHLIYYFGIIRLFVSKHYLELLMPLILTNILVYFLGYDGYLDTRILINLIPFIGLIIASGFGFTVNRK